MTIFGGIVVYLVIWWLVLFMVLPWGIRAQSESSDAHYPAGSDPGAPQNANIKIKAFITTAIACVLWGIFYVLFSMDILSITSPYA